MNLCCRYINEREGNEAMNLMIGWSEIGNCVSPLRDGRSLEAGRSLPFVGLLFSPLLFFGNQGGGHKLKKKTAINTQYPGTILYRRKEFVGQHYKYSMSRRNA